MPNKVKSSIWACSRGCSLHRLHRLHSNFKFLSVSRKHRRVQTQCVEPTAQSAGALQMIWLGLNAGMLTRIPGPEAKLSGRHQDRGHLWNKNMSSYIALPFSPFNLRRHISPCFTWTVHLYLSDVPRCSLALNTPLCVQPEILPRFHLYETETTVGKDEKKGFSVTTSDAFPGSSPS